MYNVHLGTAVLERRYQAPRLAAFVHDHRVTGPKIILGDFNEWMRGLATQTLSSLFKSVDIQPHLRRKRTYPGFFPLLHLDHIYYEGQVDVRSVELPRTRRALIASDHLPLVANLRISFWAEGRGNGQKTARELAALSIHDRESALQLADGPAGLAGLPARPLHPAGRSTLSPGSVPPFLPPCLLLLRPLRNPHALHETPRLLNRIDS